MGTHLEALTIYQTVLDTISDALMRGDVYDPDLESVSITVGEVRMSTDLKHATVFVLPLGGGDIELVLEALNRNRREIRHIVTKSISLKYSPDLKFLADRSFDQMDATTALLNREEVRRDLSDDQDEGSMD